MVALPAEFRLARYRFTLRLEQPWEVYGWAGSVLRGAFAWAFKRVTCVVRHRDCSRCLLHSQCAYTYLCETTPPADAQVLRKLTALPRPFVLEPPLAGRLPNPLSFSFGLVLIGRAIEYLPYFVLAFLELGQRGLGKQRVKYQVEAVTAERPKGGIVPIYAAEDEVLHDAEVAFTAADLHARACRLHTSPPYHLTLHFLTPTRLKFAGHSVPCIEFHHLIRALLRRLSSLCYFHCGTAWEVDFRGLIAQAGEIRTARADLEWVPQRRYSHRQERMVKIGGFVGSITFAGDLTPFFPLLVAGEWVHVGKGCVMGLGRYGISLIKGPESSVGGKNGE